MGEEGGPIPVPRAKPPEADLAFTRPQRDEVEDYVWKLETPETDHPSLSFLEDERVSPPPFTSDITSISNIVAARFPHLPAQEEGLASSSVIPERAEVSLDPTLPSSQSIGEDGFGGFSTGFGNGDPWGGRGFSSGKEEWGEGGSRRSSGFSEASEQVTSTDGVQDEGWAGMRQVRTASLPPKTADENNWEEAQARIRLKQKHAVSYHDRQIL